MRILTLATALLVLFSCKPSNKTLDEEIRNLFFNVNTRSSYSAMVNYFKSQKELTYIKEHGYTEYPPLTALDGREHKVYSELFVFNKYRDLKKLQKGGLFVTRMDPQDTSPVSLQINLSWRI